MKKKSKLFKNSIILSYFLYIMVNLYLFTIRIKVENEEELIDVIENDGSAVLCLSHQHFFVCVKAFKKYRKYSITAIISRSNDGDVLARIAHLNGYTTIRGSSSRGGKEAMDLMVEHLLKKKRICVHAVDGPKGPLGIVKAGSISIAQKSGSVIFPCVMVAESAWNIGTWDKNLIPKPFSKITIIYKEKITTDSIVTSDDFENKRLQLENTIKQYLN